MEGRCGREICGEWRRVFSMELKRAINQSIIDDRGENIESISSLTLPVPGGP